VRQLEQRGVPLAKGRVILATWQPHETAMLGVVRELGLEWQVTFNKGAVMLLPSGVNKETGLERALSDLGVTRHEVVALGDAENDHALLAGAEIGVAVANALPALKARADFVTTSPGSAGVIEVISKLLSSDLAEVKPVRHDIAVGEAEGEPTSVPPSGARLLVCGSSGTGKSTFASGILERLVERGYQVCLVDPEGDFESFPGVTPLGSVERAPNVEEVLALLADARVHPAVSLLGLPMRDRPAFLSQLWPGLQQLRARAGRPHWLVLEEAHHMLPRGFDISSAAPLSSGGLLLVTVHPDLVSQSVLQAVNFVVAIGEAAPKALTSFFQGAGLPSPERYPSQGPGEALLWRDDRGGLRTFTPASPRAEHRRHRRKYATGDLRENAFRFRGPEEKLDLRAQNLQRFLQLADGIDDETWRFHLAQGDYARWFREAIKDEELVRAAAEAEAMAGVDARETRRHIRRAIEQRYVVEV